jgi:indolepyruvate ferredoxin oxidoreductase beta subunit
MTNILFCGIGGQGILKASEICGMAALSEGYHVKKSEVHGMAQRGGSVESHLRFSEKKSEKIYSPLIIPGRADFLVCLYPDEEKRLRHYLKPKGINFLPFLDRFKKESIDSRFLNTYFLGILSAFLPIKKDYWLKSMNDIFRRAREENHRIFTLAARFASEQKPGAEE